MSTSSWKHNDNLRVEDRYVRDLIWRYPNGPRAVDKPLQPIRNTVYLRLVAVFAFIIAGVAFLVPYISSLFQTGAFWQSRFGVGFITVVISTYEVWTPEGNFQHKFRIYSAEHDTWVQKLEEGDRVQVLLHPTKNKVLISYGP